MPGGDQVTGKSQGWGCSSVTPGRDVCIWKAQGRGAELGKVVSVPTAGGLGARNLGPFCFEGHVF